MPKKKYTVHVDLPKEIVEEIGEEKLGSILSDIVSTHAKVLRVIMESRKEKRVEKVT